MSNLWSDETLKLAERWAIKPSTVINIGYGQSGLMKRGRNIRQLSNDTNCSPIKSLSQHCQAQGVFVRDVVEASGLTKQTLNRLAKQRNTHRLRDLVAGTAVLVAARNRSKVHGH